MIVRTTALSHVDAEQSPCMVDVSSKVPTERRARARAEVAFPPDVAAHLGIYPSADLGAVRGPKGPIFATAKIAGIMAAKRTHELIPLCHPLALDYVEVDFHIPAAGTVEIVAICGTTHKTGVEMEALTAASVAALTIYDMCKALSHAIEIRSVVLLAKSGGKAAYARPG
jgi:cyclic pyranopterin phosphate synthase